MGDRWRRFGRAAHHRRADGREHARRLPQSSSRLRAAQSNRLRVPRSAGARPTQQADGDRQRKRGRQGGQHC